MTYCTDRLISIPRLLRPPHSSSSSYPQVNCPLHSQLTEQAQVGWIMLEHEGAKQSLRRTVVKSRVLKLPLLLLQCKQYYSLCGFIKQIIYYVILYRRYLNSSYLKPKCQATVQSQRYSLSCLTWNSLDLNYEQILQIKH